MNTLFRYFVVLTTYMSFLVTQCFAADANPFSLRDNAPPVPASEYIFRNDLEESLIPVYLLGAVARPGVYHVPVKTDLLSLLALSGGPTASAELSEVLIRRPNTEDVNEVNAEHLFSHPEQKSPQLASYDVVFVKSHQPVVSNDTVLIVGLISGILGIVVSGYLISQQVKK